MKPDELDSSFSAAKHEIIETKASDTFGLGDAETSTTLRSVAKFLKHATSQHIDNDADVDTSAKTKEFNDYSVKRTDPFKVPSPLVRLNSKPPRVIRLSPQGQDGQLNQWGIVIISFTIELTTVWFQSSWLQ